ncbi:MAG: bifunctional phosphopantothenoylcysteine decarboxylase/phosphopantothenate synthase [Novosphingobium sp.]|nr:bifunctional phosphopantothenoylcysteine decarboxylase/phosphopantothenate synthase [Novosphingobium sp.]MCP5404355.1 bifunctional phosphopantothenoylcysteine decarboxylase/phosphopantothenate synthase [Novosphingobium sp.]
MNDPETTNGPRVLLIVGGGIAAYKACELVRMIKKGGGDVTCVLTEGGAQFVTPMALAALSGNPVYTTLWDLKNEVEMGHIELSREADLIVVCPATANLLAKMASGIADDLATTVLLATDKPVMAVPAMNVRMWEHAATRKNVETLREAGVFVMEPDEGAMACGEFGPGRLPEPVEVWGQIAWALDIDPGELPALPRPEPAEPQQIEQIDTDFEQAEDIGLGGLSASMIIRSPKATLELDKEPPLDEAEFSGEYIPPGEAPLPGEEPQGEEAPPPLNLDSPLLSKKGTARAAPPTDPEALNHLVSGKVDAPEPFEEEVLAPPIVFEGDPEDLPLYGKHVLVTAGPTHEAIDPVRYIANRSSGKQGYAIAAAAAAAGARVTLVSGPVNLMTPPGVTRVDVESAEDMADAVKNALPADVAVMVAAVADWRPKEFATEKIKKRGDAPPALMLTENPDILANLAGDTRRPELLIGFAAETENVLKHAKEKRKRKGADWIIANDVTGDTMGGATNTVHIVSGDEVESLPEMPKEDVAHALVERIIDAVTR